MATKWPSFDNNTTVKFSLRFIIDNEQHIIFPESITVNGEEICDRKTRRAQRMDSTKGIISVIMLPF